MCDHLRYVTITRNELAPGTLVMVPQTGMAVVGEGPCVIAMARVIGPAEQEGIHWLEVLSPPVAGLGPMPQMFNEQEILGVPAYGLVMAGMPTAEPDRPPAAG